MRINVDLPAPFSPTSAWISPGSTSSDAPRLARMAPNDLSIPTIRIVGIAELGSLAASLVDARPLIIECWEP